MDQPYRTSLESSATDIFPIHMTSSDDLQLKLEKLEQREHQIMELLHCEKPERIVHDLRNVLNELQLLRLLTEEIRK